MPEVVGLKHEPETTTLPGGVIVADSVAPFGGSAAAELLLNVTGIRTGPDELVSGTVKLEGPAIVPPVVANDIDVPAIGGFWFASLTEKTNPWTWFFGMLQPAEGAKEQLTMLPVNSRFIEIQIAGLWLQPACAQPGPSQTPFGPSYTPFPLVST